ncbi:MAG TPA: SipW-dependent-type signal peptide-containing protein [Candidatus Lumbricidophila sp.]|nr:SipW-dependent-type signal peptide-containing protein [Candidatus Lumbricidophila sp.]
MGKHRAASQRGLRRRRWSAALAGGLVLGLGATVTLAAWNDSEFATGTFGASVFDLESKSAGAGTTTYASRTSAPGASLAFSATAMSPSVSHYAWLDIRTTVASTVGGTVTLTGVTNNSGGLVGALEYRAVRMPSAASTCDATAFSGSPTFIAGGSSTYLAVTTVPGSPVTNPIAAAGAELGFCFDVRVAANAANSYQGTTATVTWSFTGTSN